MDIQELLKPRYKVIADIKSGMYSVCDHGFIVNNRTGKRLKTYINKKDNGYEYIKLQDGKNQRSFHVAVLVGEAFVDNPESKPCINHDDGDKLNNFYTNLKWATYKENSEHAFRTGLGKSGLKHYNSKFSIEDIIEIKELWSKGLKRFEIARIYNVSETAINNLTKGATYKNTALYEFNLLRPRFKIVETYPFSPYKTGDIITTGENSTLFRMFSQFPKVFKSLQWWEERDKKDMPTYLKSESGDPYYVKVLAHFQGYFYNENGDWPYRNNQDLFIIDNKMFIRTDNQDAHYRDFIPISEEEYNTQTQ